MATGFRRAGIACAGVARRALGAVVGLLTGALLAAVAPAAVSTGAAAANRPNILFILTDDQDVGSGLLAMMPNLQSLLVVQGTTFDNMLVPLSLCCPSRTTILRGQYPHNTQVLTNALPLGGFEKAYASNLEADTLATLLHGAGYRTVLLGKYLNGYPDGAGPRYIPPGWDEWYSPSAGNPYSEFNYTLNENGRPVKYGANPADYLTDVILARAVDFIARAASSPQPLFIYFATYAPHSPYTPAPRHANLFPGLTAPRWPSFNEADVSDKPAYVAAKPLLGAAQIADIDASFRKRAQALQAVDEAIAGLLAALQATGRLDDTVVVFTSDNGYHMGEHRLPPGKYTPYETDLHVPLVVRGPSVPAGVVRHDFTANVDLAETFAELAGAASLPFSDGRSLLEVLRTPSAGSWRRAFLLEEFASGEFVLANEAEALDAASTTGVREPPDAQELAAAAPSIPSYYGFRATAYKYVEYRTGEKELYVLTADPYELDNKAAAVAPAVARTLAAYLRTLDACAGDGCRDAEAVGPPALLAADFTFTDGTLTSESPVTLSAAAAGTPPYAFDWSFDGRSAVGANAVVRLEPGANEVTLRVRDAIGAEATVTKIVDVLAAVRKHVVGTVP